MNWSNYVYWISVANFIIDITRLNHKEKCKLAPNLIFMKLFEWKFPWTKPDDDDLKRRANSDLPVSQISIERNISCSHRKRKYRFMQVSLQASIPAIVKT